MTLAERLTTRWGFSAGNDRQSPVDRTTEIDREHLSINTDKVRARLQTNREHVHGNMLRTCLERWERIIAGNDIDTVRKISVSDTETDREMRNMSPLSVLLSESERMRVLDPYAPH